MGRPNSPRLGDTSAFQIATRRDQFVHAAITFLVNRIASQHYRAYVTAVESIGADAITRQAAEAEAQAAPVVENRDYDLWTGFGSGVLRTHARSQCSGTPCCLHAPSDHPLTGSPMSWLDDRMMMERICEHGIHHPDPDDLDYKRRVLNPALYLAGDYETHDCDGCCVPSRIAIRWPFRRHRP
ncbi:hypothetical protein [Leifsonia sp. Leaf264]|uniref:hypothetical protein n=1 Tax=Leifsonia sp. Leaf264 TaxID=1736314 RepID=UPI0006F3582A|nr:hypothetical protein [Leifsonia sp. Leaf264]KQO98893.1 hypothetical protein ASF30_12590 [Leifsonia sp. Leaf264]